MKIATKPLRHLSRVTSARRRTAMVAAAVAFAVGAGAAPAQDDSKVKAGLTVWKQSGCSDCHGPFANGDKTRGEMPTGANLRTTSLDDAAIAQTVACGRPGTGMPYFDERAYTKHACYGQPLGPVPDGLEPGPNQLTPEEVGDLLAYLKARVVGRADITLEDCRFFYGSLANSRCADFKETP